ncbi:O-antigen ligase family protein [Paramagnetospirillum magneticum]|uniref:O-antigen ligase family protein n=1 Tax=Paramagnetospirillum magneticum TaxID=84159 RepID=UPI0013051CA0|nr:O-antigen ligase family protein [Paramagnetospirillum magneticum]
MTLLWVLLTTYLGLAFLHGALSYGLQTAVASYRASLYLTVGVSYFALFQHDRNDTIWTLNLVILAGLAVVLFAIAAWLVPEWRPQDPGHMALSSQAYERSRVLPAQAAQFIALAALLSLPSWLQVGSSLWLRLATLPLLAVSIFLFHRSVWVMLAVSVLVTLAASGRGAVRAFVVVQFLLVALALVWLLLVGLDMDILSASLRTAVNEAVDLDNNTLDWRIQGWRILVERAISDGPLSILFGAGFGIGYERNIAQLYVTASPHNYYVELFLTSGLLGCGLFVLSILSVFRRALSQALHGGANEMLALPGMVIGVVVYSASYSPQYDTALILGLILALPAIPRRRPIPEGVSQPAPP